jgi:hypothetical protein
MENENTITTQQFSTESSVATSNKQQTKEHSNTDSEEKATGANSVDTATEIATGAESRAPGGETRTEIVGDKTTLQSGLEDTATETTSYETATIYEPDSDSQEMSTETASNNGEQSKEKRRCAVANGATCSK